MPKHVHEHPSLVISLRTRTRIVGTVNLALALRGRSCGWGSCECPRRTFSALRRRRLPDTGLHFIELAILRNAMRDERVLFRIGDARADVEIRGRADTTGAET